MNYQTKKRSILVLAVLLVVSLVFAFGFMKNTDSASAYTNTIRYGTNVVFDYNVNHWADGQGQRVAGEPDNGGKWYFGYGDVSTSALTWSQVANFEDKGTDSSTGNPLFSVNNGNAHQFVNGYDLSTRLYTSTSTQSMFKYLAEADGYVKLSGMMAKAGPVETTGVTLPWMNFNWGADKYNWNGGTFEVSIWRQTKGGNIACIDQKTFSAAWRYDINASGDQIAVGAGDAIYICYKCTNFGDAESEWETNCIALISSEFTAMENDAYSSYPEYAATTLNGSNASHVTAQNTRNSGETSGYWRFGRSSIPTVATYDFTELTKDTSVSSDDGRFGYDSHYIFWKYQVLTNYYSGIGYGTAFEWTAEEDGVVSFTGLVSKADSNKAVLASQQNQVKKVDMLENWNADTYGWVDGDSYTVGMYKVTASGTATEIAENTFTKEFAWLVPSSDISVSAGDRIVFIYKCNALGTALDGSTRNNWYTNAVMVVNAHFKVGLELGQAYGNRMILQANKNVNICGFGAAGKTITVTVKDSSGTVLQTKTGTVDSNGDWKVVLDSMTPSFDNKTVVVTDGTDTKTLTNVRVGQVWLCSGQSNMAYTLAKLLTDRSRVPEGKTPWTMTDEEITAAGLGDYLTYGTEVYSNVNLYQVGDNAQTSGVDKKGVPYTYTNGSWAQSGTLQQWMGYSAYALGFAFKLQQEINQPVGIIVSAVGGSSVEEWLSPSIITSENLSGELKHGTSKPASRLYNGMIYPIKDVTVSGLLWYQGCADRGWNESTTGDGQAVEYCNSWQTKMIALCKQMRQDFGSNMPIVVQQIVQDKSSTKAIHIWEAAWKLQDKVTNLYTVAGLASGLPYSYALGGDPTGVSNTIHPIDKYGISKDAANIALRYVYGDKTAAGIAAYPKAIYRSGTNVVVDYGASETDSNYKLKLSEGSQVYNLEAYNGSSWVVVSGATVDGTRIIIPNASSYTKIRYANYNVMGYGTTQSGWLGQEEAYIKYNSEYPVNLYTENGVPCVAFDEIAVGSGASGVNMSISEDLSMTFTFELKLGYTNPVVYFAFGSVNKQVTATLNSDGTYSAKFNAIDPRNLGVALSITKIVAKDANGENTDLQLYWSKTSVTPVEYLTELKSSSSDTKVQNLIVALLNYGAAAQNYAAQYHGYTVTSLVNASLNGASAGAYDQAAVKAAMKQTYTGTASTEIYIDKASIVYSNQLGFAFSIAVKKGTDVSGAVLNVSASGVNKDISFGDMTVNSGDGQYDYYIATYSGIHPKDLSTVFTFTVKNGGSAVGRTLQYNVFANMANVYAHEEASSVDVDLIKSLYVYGEAVKAYLA